MADLNAIDCAAFLLAAFLPVGYVHTAWLKSSWSRQFSMPLDFGMKFRGRRVFGTNKMLRGLMVIVPGGGVTFFLLSTFIFRPWPISTLQYAGLGVWAGLGFILGELPNSFFKRQLDIQPGTAPASLSLKWIWFVIDHTDSLIGMLVAVRLFVPLPGLTWVAVLGSGFFIHLFFSVAMFRLGIKARPL